MSMILQKHIFRSNRVNWYIMCGYSLPKVAENSLLPVSCQLYDVVLPFIDRFPSTVWVVRMPAHPGNEKIVLHYNLDSVTR